MFLAYSFRSLWPTVNAYLFGHPEQRLYRVITPVLELVGAIVWLYVFARDRDKTRETRKGLAVVGVGQANKFGK